MEIRDLARVETIGQDVKGYISQIEEALKRELDRYSWSRFYGPLVYAVQGGKRIRPLIVMLSTDSVGGKVADALDSAVAVELLHTESIIHDDIIDQEVSRRDRMAFHVKYGYGASLLTADFVFGMILNIASRYNDSRIARELSSAALRMCEGEFEELKIDPKICKLAWDEYINLTQKKTSSIFEVAAKTGGIIGGAPENVINALSAYGLHLGTAYQIQDDVLDWGLEGKVAEALQVNTGTDGVIEHMNQMSKSHASQAKHNLAPLKDTVAKRCLLNLADFVVKGTF